MEKNLESKRANPAVKTEELIRVKKKGVFTLLRCGWVGLAPGGETSFIDIKRRWAEDRRGEKVQKGSRGMLIGGGNVPR